MAMKLLRTRVTIPPRRAGAVQRPRLVDKLNAGLTGRLALISAPAGFGKTTLVLEWLRQLPAPGFAWTSTHCAWVSLDPDDDRPSQFFAYLLAAIQRVTPDFGEDLFASLDAAAEPDLTVLVQDLLNEFNTRAGPYLLVLDDFHLITNGTVLDLTNRIVEYLPSNVYIVLTARDTPRLDLPRWRARGYLNEITAVDLRFTADEARSFLSETMQLEVPEETAVMLEDRTEGWAAGLQLAALTLRVRQALPDPAETFGWDERISGLNRDVADYLLAEVIERQTQETRDFLMHTAILPRFTAPLCDALLSVQSAGERTIGRPAQEILERLEKSDLFLVPLDGERRWYRYHHLFGELLQNRLESAWPDSRIRELHRAASIWFHRNGVPKEAIEHAFLAGAQADAARLIAELPMEQLWHSDLGSNISVWSGQLSEEALVAHPQVVLQTAGAQLIRGQISDLRVSLEWLSRHGFFEPERVVIDAILVRNNGQLHEAQAMLQEAVERLPASSDAIRDIAHLQLAVCSMELGDTTKSARHVDLILKKHDLLRRPEEAVPPIYLQALQMQGGLAEIRGDLVQAQEIYRSGLDQIAASKGSNAMAGLFDSRLGAIHYQWNEMDKAEAYIDRALAWGERTRISDIVFGSLFGLADLACYHRDPELLEDVIAQMNRLIREARIPGMDARSAAIAAGLWLRMGELDRAVRWANASGLRLDIPPPYPVHEGYQILAAIRIAENHALGAGEHLPLIRTLVDQLILQAEQYQNRGLMIRGYLLKALVLEGMSQTREAAEALNRSLQLGESGGYLRVYLDAGEPLRDLLQKAQAYGEQMTPIRRLLVAFAKEPAEVPERDRMGDSRPPANDTDFPDLAAPLIDPLTDRETEVLQLIAVGLTNKDIQVRLFISNNTVRTHIKNLYGKLGVSDRTQAVLRAQALGLV